MGKPHTTHKIIEGKALVSRTLERRHGSLHSELDVSQIHNEGALHAYVYLTTDRVRYSEKGRKRSRLPGSQIAKAVKRVIKADLLPIEALAHELLDWAAVTRAEIARLTEPKPK